jgi:hypothetical protein
MLCDGGELWSGSAVQFRSWSVLERKGKGTGEPEKGEESEVKSVVFAVELIEFFRCVEAEQQEQE